MKQDVAQGKVESQPDPEEKEDHSIDKTHQHSEDEDGPQASSIYHQIPVRFIQAYEDGLS